MIENLRMVICPVCGRTILNNYHPNENRMKVKSYKFATETDYYGRETTNYLEGFLESVYDSDRDYFAVEGEPGKGGLAAMKDQKLSPEEWPEGFAQIKHAMFRALKWWLKKKWINEEDIDQLYDYLFGEEG